MRCLSFTRNCNDLKSPMASCLLKRNKQHQSFEMVCSGVER
jgi:hypothetical protein